MDGSRSTPLLHFLYQVLVASLFNEYVHHYFENVASSRSLKSDVISYYIGIPSSNSAQSVTEDARPSVRPSVRWLNRRCSPLSLSFAVR